MTEQQEKFKELFDQLVLDLGKTLIHFVDEHQLLFESNTNICIDCFTTHAIWEAAIKSLVINYENHKEFYPEKLLKLIQQCAEAVNVKFMFGTLAPENNTQH